MRIVLADGRAKVRSALQLLLEQEQDVQVVGEAETGEGLLALAEAQKPEVVLVDWELPGKAMGEVVAELRQLVPAVKVIVLSVRPEARHEAAEAGAEAFVSKNAPSETLLAALNQYRAGPMGSRLTPGGGPATVNSHLS